MVFVPPFLHASISPTISLSFIPSFLPPPLLSPIYLPLLVSSFSFFLLLLPLSYYFPQLIPLLTLTPSFLPPTYVYIPTYACLHRIAVPHTTFCLCLLLPSSFSFSDFLLIFPLPYSSSHSQMCHFSLTSTTVVIQRTFLKLDS